MALIKKFLTFFGLKKKNRFIVFGISLNMCLFIYRITLLYNHKGSLVSIEKNLQVIIKILEYGFIFFLSVILCSLYLKKKKEENLDKIIVKFKFFPKIFFFLIKIEFFLTNNPILAIFLIVISVCICFLQIGTDSKNQFFVFFLFSFFRTVFLVPYLFFRSTFDQKDFKGINLFSMNFLRYGIFLKKTQQESLRTSRALLLSFSLMVFVFAFKISKNI